jgi:hypothetical protein
VVSGLTGYFAESKILFRTYFGITVFGLRVKICRLNPQLDPCCGSKVIDEPGACEICEVCHWEDGPIQAGNPTFSGGEKKYSLLDARSAWAQRDLTNEIV